MTTQSSLKPQMKTLALYWFLKGIGYVTVDSSQEQRGTALLTELAAKYKYSSMTRTLLDETWLKHLNQLTSRQYEKVNNLNQLFGIVRPYYGPYVLENVITNLSSGILSKLELELKSANVGKLQNDLKVLLTKNNPNIKYWQSEWYLLRVRWSNINSGII